MDYEEEQANELETLVSIYCDDIEVVNETAPRKVKINLQSSDYDEAEGRGVKCGLIFTHSPKYPDTCPEIQVESNDSIDETEVDQLTQHLKQTAEENLGMVVIFTLAAAAQEWIDNKSDRLKKEQEERALKKQLAEEEADRKRFEGTKVTVESFLAWRNTFEIETGIASRREKSQKENRKLTGKELFLRDTTLNESDLKFLDDGDAVKVDESLFQDMDDLDLSDEDDEDYVPGMSEGSDDD